MAEGVGAEDLEADDGEDEGEGEWLGPAELEDLESDIVSHEDDTETG